MTSDRSHTRKALALLGALVLVAPTGALAADATALPDLYRSVASVHWVVRDVDATKAHWARLGFPALRDLGELRVAGSFRGQKGSARLRVAMARFDRVDVYWIQPLDGENAFTDSLRRHGEGVFSVNYEVGDAAALDAEVARLGRLGVGVLQQGELPLASGLLRVVHMDTEPGGKYVVGLVAGPRTPEGVPDAAPAAPPFPVKLSQYALVVENLEAVSAYWARLGFPAMELKHPTLGELRYRGAPAGFDQLQGWHRHGTVTWEWLQALKGPTVYLDFLKSHGEGFHHFAFDVPDMDAAERGWTAVGAPIIQSGSWGEKGRPGSGRFAYADTSTIGGVTIELLWNHR